MSVTLATAWRPRGELNRFQRLLPQLGQVYSGIVISLPPDVSSELVVVLKDLSSAVGDLLAIVITPDWSWGRFSAVQKALEAPTSHVQYADFDRLLRWVETRPEEWREMVELIQQNDCLIIGRTGEAYWTHPQALIQTELISNRVVSFLLGQDVDVSAGCKGFSRKAAEYLVANTTPGRALGTDAEWPLTLQQAGFLIDYVEVDGLDWESADRYQEQAVGPDEQQRSADAYDANPANWARRVKVALEIVVTGLETAQRGEEISPF